MIHLVGWQKVSVFRSDLLPAFSQLKQTKCKREDVINPLNAELNSICHLLALLEAHPILHVSRVRVKIQLGLVFRPFLFMTIYFYNLCRVGPSTPDLWCMTVATLASFLYLVRSQLFSGVHVFLLSLFQCSSFKLIVIFPLMTSIKKTEKKKNQNS